MSLLIRLSTNEERWKIPGMTLCLGVESGFPAKTLRLYTDQVRVLTNILTEIIMSFLHTNKNVKSSDGLGTRFTGNF